MSKMDVCYKKVMRNGAVTSKFKIGSPTNPNHTPASLVARDHAAEVQKPAGFPLELSSTHHDSNCARCYKLKKKCSRTYPRCDYCTRSDAVCEYIDRRKRRLRFEEVTPAVDSSGGSSQDMEPRKPILIASLVNHEEGAESFRNIDLTASSSPFLGATGGSRTDLRMGHKPAVSVTKNVVSSALTNRNHASLQGELLAVRPIEDASLPSAFVHTFFANYEWKYPFLNRHDFGGKLEPFSFQNETLVGLDVYLVMAIGCLIYDASFGTSHYPSFFSDSFVESIVDMISYDIKSEDDIHKAHLLILLSIYAINVGNTTLIWNIVGFLDRLVIFLTDFSGKNTQKDACMRKRCFWTIFNLDKELSLSLDKPSQFIPTAIIRVDCDFADSLNTTESERSAAFMAHSVMLHKLQDRMLSHRLKLVPTDHETLTKFSSNLEVWRVGISSLIHTEYADSSLLQNFIGLVNLDYYYLLVELDQLSSTESFQFTLQFLSNSFSLLLLEGSEKKESGGTSIYSLFWFLKFFKVIDYSVGSLLRMLRSDNREFSTKLIDFNNNVQLEINLLKFLLNSKSSPQRFVRMLELYLSRLKVLYQKLVAFNAIEGKDTDKLQQEIHDLFELA